MHGLDLAGVLIEVTGKGLDQALRSFFRIFNESDIEGCDSWRN